MSESENGNPRHLDRAPCSALAGGRTTASPEIIAAEPFFSYTSEFKNSPSVEKK